MSGRNLDLFKQLAPGSLTMFQWLYEQHKLDLVALLFYFVLFWRSTRVGGWTMEQREESVIRCTVVNSQIVNKNIMLGKNVSATFSQLVP